jgi:8-oxo-dGTP pyrophosphatase MutT (NUDIX family)
MKVPNGSIPLSLLKERLPVILQGRRRNVSLAPELIPASVLIPLFEKEANSHLLLIKRSRYVQYHPYQVSFPGGVLEVGDRDLKETALRETFEEIGVAVNTVEILGLLDDYPTISNFRITPFVGIIPYPYHFQINQKETKALIEVPLTTLFPQRKEKVLPFQGGKRHTYIYQSGPFTIWGITARIIKDFLDILAMYFEFFQFSNP